MESIWKNMGTNLGWNVGIDDTVVVGSIEMTPIEMHVTFLKTPFGF
jgi:hypothetical protein